jgi:hypothetical protein
MPLGHDFCCYAAHSLARRGPAPVPVIAQEIVGLRVSILVPDEQGDGRASGMPPEDAGQPSTTTSMAGPCDSLIIIFCYLMDVKKERSA